MFIDFVSARIISKYGQNGRLVWPRLGEALLEMAAIMDPTIQKAHVDEVLMQIQRNYPERWDLSRTTFSQERCKEIFRDMVLEQIVKQIGKGVGLEYNKLADAMNILSSKLLLN